MFNQDQVKKSIEAAKKIVVIQAENPDGDSLGSALALEEILGDLGKDVTLYCPVNIPRYLGYAKGWDRVTDEFPSDFDCSIIVDTSSAALLERAIVPENVARIAKVPCIVLDHHTTASTLPFENIGITDTSSVATGELIFKIAKALDWPLNAQASEHLVISILADSLGLTTEATTAQSIHAVAELVEHGARLDVIENRRREFMKKSAEILTYKGRLLQRVEYFLDEKLALIHIPWEEIAEFSDQYNPSVLVLDEMRLVTNVRVAIAIKTYPDGKITGKIRGNPDAKVAETIAKYFGGGGHPFVAGFKTYSNTYDEVKHELIGVVDKTLEEYDRAAA
jgi:phosphoesterase RecJ-like protein